MTPPAYPATLVVRPSTSEHDRLTTFFRPILAIPHSILVGPIYWSARSGGIGFIGAAAYAMAVMSWFTLLFTGTHVRGMRDFAMFYLRWRTRALAYMALFVDAYPPFADADYPASITIVEPTEPRDLRSIGLRLFLVIPHIIMLVFLLVAWLITTIVAWVVILFTGFYPTALFTFGVSAMRWVLRVEAYMLLLVDEYPPFRLD